MLSTWFEQTVPQEPLRSDHWNMYLFKNVCSARRFVSEPQLVKSCDGQFVSYRGFCLAKYSMIVTQPTFTGQLSEKLLYTKL